MPFSSLENGPCKNKVDVTSKKNLSEMKPLISFKGETLKVMAESLSIHDVHAPKLNPTALVPGDQFTGMKLGSFPVSDILIRRGSLLFFSVERKSDDLYFGL